ncbi:MAG: PD-(D/E)XK nuclease family protein, partial [Clostridia bacterium]|nr:PD-(D/E)XK nuclease family protein [Clostridia bacterium]
FVRAVSERGLDWAALDDAAADALTEDLLPALLAAHNDGILLASPRLRAGLFLLVETVRSGARAIARQIRAGAFLPLGAECRFGPGEAFPPLPLLTEKGEEAWLAGVIDRVDAAAGEDRRYIRVIDYKSGQKKFDFGAVIDGLSLQLPLYLAAAGAESSRAGLYYMTLRGAPPEDGEDLEAAAMETVRLRGVTLSDPRVLRLSDYAIDAGGGLLEGVKADGESFRGSLLTGEQMNGLIARALDKARESIRAMRAGRIEARPFERGCEHCDYRSVCRFDPSLPGCRARRRRSASREAFFEEGGEGA